MLLTPEIFSGTESRRKKESLVRNNKNTFRKKDFMKGRDLLRSAYISGLHLVCRKEGRSISSLENLADVLLLSFLH